MDNNQLWKHLVAGAAAGALSRTCTAPLDRIKVHLQVKGSECSSLKAVFKLLLKEGGWIGFWRGNGMNVLKIAPETALKFMTYEMAKRWFRSQQNSSNEVNFKQRLCAGAIAGAVSQTVIYPLEVLKTRLVLRRTIDDRRIISCAQKIWREKGIWGFYRGYLPNLFGILPYAGVDLAIYETLKRRFLRDPIAHNKKIPESKPQFLILSFCGLSSTCCGQLVSYPFALVRTRLQAASCSGEGRVTMSSLVSEIHQKEGLPGFYRGIVPNFLKVAPAVSVSYVVYEWSRRLLGAEMC